MVLTIRTRLTIWYAVLVACILAILGTAVVCGAAWGLRRAADKELTSGIEGVVRFLQHKFDMHEMGNLNEELREHSSLLPRGKMFRVSKLDGSVLYQSEAMIVVTPIVARPGELRKKTLDVNGRSYRSIGEGVTVGTYVFLIQVAVDQTEYRELTMGLAWILVLSIPLAAFLAACVGYWMSGGALAPILRITETANSIDARSLSRRLPLLGTDDELDRLSATINHMLDRLAKSYERIAQFTADASHELRTPVALIRSNAELLLMGQQHDTRTRQRLADILTESTYMTRLIGDLLTLARTSDQDTSIPMELLELDQEVLCVLDRVRAQARSHEVTLEYRLHSQIAPFRGNQGMIERVLLILIDNAVRYTPPGGEIWIETWVTKDRCGLIVNDTGIGIAARDHERIFERFFRVDMTRTPGDGGSGLGLSIAKSLVQLHCGSIHVESEEGAGATFEVGFWRADVASEPAERDRGPLNPESPASGPPFMREHQEKFR